MILLLGWTTVSRAEAQARPRRVVDGARDIGCATDDVPVSCGSRQTAAA
jgi:hypothetical protein